MSRESGIRAKNERANQHINELEIELRAFVENCRDSIKTQNQFHGRDGFTYGTFLPIPVKIPLIIGDAVHNLRSSLDHLACQLAFANGVTSIDHIHYPICKTPESYKSKETRKKTKGIADPALKLIEATQPYNTGYSDIGVLHKLDIYDKHRLLVVTHLGEVAIGVYVAKPPTSEAGGNVTIQRPIFLEPRNIGHLVPVEPVSKHNKWIEITPIITFGEPEVVKGKPVIPFLPQLSKFVESVINQFVPFL